MHVSDFYDCRNGNVMTQTCHELDVQATIKSFLHSSDPSIAFDKVRTSSFELEFVVLAPKPHHDDPPISWYAAIDQHTQVCSSVLLAHAHVSLSSTCICS
jgi:hypothetical protein